MGWKDFLPFEIVPEKKSLLDVKKPISPQVQGKTESVPNFNIPATPTYNQPAPAYSPAYNPTTFGGGLSTEEQQKWVNYMNTIYNDARKQNSIFDDFENQVDMLAAAIPQEGARITAIGALMNGKGISKAQVIEAGNRVMQIVTDAKTTFLQDLAARQKTGVTDRQIDIQNKQAQIQKLTEEIQGLNQTIADNANKLATREQGFNQCWGALVAKLTNDINNITNFVQG